MRSTAASAARSRTAPARSASGRCRASARRRRTRRTTTRRSDFFTNRTEKQAAKVRVTEKALDRLEVIEKPWEGWQLQLSIATAARSGAVVARLNDAVVQRGDFTLGPIDVEIGWAERVAILGPNGSGKTTLLNALLGRLPLTAGTQWLGPGVVVGEVDQTRASLTSDEPVLDAFVRASGLQRQQEARSVLAKFGLSAEHVSRPAMSLSPGERTRAVLAILMRHQLPRSRRTHQPSRPHRDRAARTSPRHLRRHALARHPRPASARRGADRPHHHRGRESCGQHADQIRRARQWCLVSGRDHRAG